MKKLLSAIVLLGSLNASAMIIGDDSYLDVCFGSSYSQDAVKCLISTITSLPVLVMADGQLELTEAQTVTRLLDDVASGGDSVMSQVAAQLGVESDVLRQQIIDNY